MHGRLKVKTTAEQEAAKQKERQEKLKLFNAANDLANEKRKEKQYDNEALKITEKILTANPDIATTWNFRKEILLAMLAEKNEEEQQELLNYELHCTEVCLHSNPKSYGSWEHRCWSLDQMPKADWKKEVELCNMYLDKDERNFHCWDYRRFVVNRAGVSPADELNYTDKKIAANFSNYSAWHYRSKLLPLVHPDPAGNKILEENKLLSEFELVQNAAFTDPSDQSAWFYHRWLLGRCKKPLDIINIHILPPAKVAICFTIPVTIGNQCQVAVLVDATEIQGSWEAIGSSKEFSKIWIFKNLCQDKDFTDEEVTVSIKHTDQEFKFNLPLKNGQATIWGNGFNDNIFSQELSAAATAQQESELESCQQLQELEPDNKWVLLTSVLLMKSLDSKKYYDSINDYITKLKEVDPYRTNYYSDLGSKYAIEHAIETMEKDKNSLDLSGKKLFSLHHFEFLWHLQSINVSGNQLESLQQLDYTPNLREVIADDNKISTSDGMQHLHHLHTISLKNNNINSVSALNSLKSCTALKSLDLRGNSITEVDGYRDLVETLLPQLNELDGVKF